VSSLGKQEESILCTRLENASENLRTCAAFEGEFNLVPPNFEIELKTYYANEEESFSFQLKLSQVVIML